MQEQVGMSSSDSDNNDDLYKYVEQDIDDEVPIFEEEQTFKKSTVTSKKEIIFQQNVVDYSKSESINIFEQKTSEIIGSGPTELLATSLSNSATKKQVQFEQIKENKSISRPQSAVQKQIDDSLNYEPKLTVTQNLLNIEQEIKKNLTGKPISEIKLLLNKYCMISNEEAQNFDLSDPNQQKKALMMLDQCINVIKLVQNDQNPFDELHYETLNNIARCYNFSGKIKQSLSFLLKAFKHVERLQRKQEQGSVTIMPELSLNICNAFIYENNSLEALNYADIAIKSSSECIKVLKKKIDKKIDVQSKDKNSDPKKLNQLLQSQIQLHIQGYQAKGKIMEKMSRYREAIKQYNHAKVVVEQNFGTNHQLFKDIVNQVSAANVNLKTQNYQGRSGSSLKSSSFKSMKRIGTGISKQATSAQSPDKVLVQFSEDTIDIRSVGGNSDFGQNSLMSTPSNHTEQQKKSRKNLASGKSQKSLQTERKSSLEHGNKKRQVRSKRPKQRINDFNYMQYINQPPFNAGYPSSGFNRFNHLQNVNRHNDQWKFNRYYTPNMLGALGYNFYNLDRKNCFYHTPIGQQKTIIKKKIVHERVEKEKPTVQQQVTVQQQPNRDYDSKLDIYLKEMQLKQQEQQRIMIDTINKQKENMIEYQRLERERAKHERENFLVQLQSLSTVEITSIKKTETKVVTEQRPQLPPVHPIFGPAVYDEKGKFWFYKQKEVKPKAPSPKKREMITSQMQTDEAPKIQIQEMALQTDEVQYEVVIPQKQKTIQKPKRMDYEKAIYILQKFFKYQSLQRKEREFYDKSHGILLDRKYNYNKYEECFEIMSMYAVPTIDNYCSCLKFSIFNYAQKKYIYLGIFDKFFTLKQYTVSQIQSLSKQKLKMIEFEYNPFKQHVLCIQQILNDQRKLKNIVLVKKGDIIEEVIQGPGEIVIDVEEKPSIDEKDIQTDEQQTIIKYYQFVEKIKQIQLWYKAKFKKIVIQKHSNALKMDKEVLVTLERIEYYKGSKKYFIIQLTKNQHKNDGTFFYFLIAREKDQQKKDYTQIKKVKYHNIRLPDDRNVLYEYVKEGVVMELDKDGKIEKLQLLRLMVDSKLIHRTGCQLIREFPLINYQKHICKVYKRHRWEDEKTKKQIVKDWKIKVLQEDQPNSEDYIVVRRLPCEVSNIDTFIQDTLEVIPNRRVIPNSILHLQWKVNKLVLKSQKYYDLNSARLKHIYLSTWYFSQYSPTIYKIPNQQDIDNKNFAPFYEIYVQKMVPKKRDAKPIRYKTQQYANYKEEERKKKYGKYRNKRGANSPSSSESDDDDNPTKYQDESSKIFWDEQLLIKMQLDEVTEAREYYKITVTRTSDKQDTDFFRIEKDVVKWPHPDVEFQYLMQNLSLKQMQNKVTGEWNIEVIGLKIRKNEERFISDTVWKQSLEQDMETEQFMSQDMNRWRNQNFACTVYNRVKHGKDYLIEAINVDHPSQRAYLRLEDLSQLRGKMLKGFIDEKLRIIDKKDQDQKSLLIADQQFGFGPDFIIDKIEFISTPEEYRIENQFNPKYLDVELEEKIDDPEDQKFEDVKPEVQEEQKEDYGSDLWNNFSLLYLPNTKFKKKVEIFIEIRFNKNPQFFKINIINSLNTKSGSDTQTIKTFKLPDPLTIKENNIQKIQDVFKQKLKIIWMDQKEWADQTIPLMLDAFLENTLMKEQIIQKLVEVKVWDDYRKKAEEKGSSDSDEVNANEQELSLIRQDISNLKQILKQIRSSLKSAGGILKWFEKFEIDGKDQYDLEEFKKMIGMLNINIDARMMIMLYLVFDRSYQGYFRYQDFEDIIQKRIKLKFKRLVHLERTRFKKNGVNINLPEVK